MFVIKKDGKYLTSQGLAGDDLMWGNISKSAAFDNYDEAKSHCEDGIIVKIKYIDAPPWRVEVPDDAQ